MIQQIRTFAKNNLAMRKFIAYTLAPSGWFDGVIKNMKIHPDFHRRIADVVACPDNARIPRVPNAGSIVKGKQVMHNGLLINVGSYYGPEVAQQLIANKGVHEPQEEVVFIEALKAMPPNATMIELGAFWAFYSMWFHSVVSGARNYMVEPDVFNMASGVKNFALNSMKGDFTQAFVGEQMKHDTNPRMICVDGFAKEKGITFIDMLHCDIQGYELDMLKGATEMMAKDAIGYFFISTHSNQVHYDCLTYLKNKGYTIVTSCDLDDTFADDGLIVAKSINYKGIEQMDVSKKVTS
jgi:Methyltransferase FkbM domain